MYTPLQQFVDKLSGVSRYEAPAQSPQQVLSQKIRDAIAYNETRGVPNAYSFSRSSGSKAVGRALGKYQVTEGELKTYGPKYLGQNITPEQFLASSTYQDNYMNGKIARLSAQGYTPHQIADIHRAGFTNSGPPGSTTYQNPAYVKSFDDAFGAHAP